MVISWQIKYMGHHWITGSLDRQIAALKDNVNKRCATIGTLPV